MFTPIRSIVCMQSSNADRYEKLNSALCQESHSFLNQGILHACGEFSTDRMSTMVNLKELGNLEE